jgi:hypothetical protein
MNREAEDRFFRTAPRRWSRWKKPRPPSVAPSIAPQLVQVRH